MDKMKIVYVLLNGKRKSKVVETKKELSSDLKKISKSKAVKYYWAERWF